MNILRRIFGWLSKSENRKAFAALTFIFIGLAAIVLGAWRLGKQSLEQKELMEQMQQVAVRRPVETERLQQEAVRRRTVEVLVEQMQKKEATGAGGRSVPGIGSGIDFWGKLSRRQEQVRIDHQQGQQWEQQQMLQYQQQRQQWEQQQMQQQPAPSPSKLSRRQEQVRIDHQQRKQWEQLQQEFQSQRPKKRLTQGKLDLRENARRIEEAKVELSPVDLILHTMQWGNIAFNAPTSMNLDEIARIQLLLGIKQTIEELKQDIKVEIEKKHLSGDIESARIKVAPLIMQAHLKGNSFEIKSITPDEQPISSEETTEWLWEIIPKRAGRGILSLTLNAKLPIEGNSTYRTIRTFSKEIGVEVTGLQQTENFIKDNWQWLWTTFFVPVGAWLWSKRGSSSTTKAT